MARMVRLVASEPMKIETGAKPVWVCACGLSATFPVCDGTHKTTARIEDARKLYFYDPATRKVLCATDEPPALPGANA